MNNTAVRAVSCAVVAAAFSRLASADGDPDLSQLVQNPIAKVISLPFQENLAFGAGPNQDPQSVMDIEPVLPLTLNANWNVITRAIVPLIYDPELTPGVGNGGGLGDISLSFYFSPARTSGSIIWGVGPFHYHSHRL